MSSPLQMDAQLPALREDLQLLPGKTDRTGRKTWLIFDALRNRYFQVDFSSVQLLRHWKAGSPEAVLERCANPDLTIHDVENLIRFVFTNALTLEAAEGDVKNYVAQANATKKSLGEQVVHNYLFFRIPLFRPHAFLRKTAWLTSFLFSSWWWRFVIFVGIVGGYLTMRQWDDFVHTFMHFFNLKGLVFYFSALVVVKILHELGHAYTATRYGCRVATMGVAFLVMFPVLFTDTTDSWKLKSRRQRLTITAAGVLTELMIAVFATFLWAFLPDGPWRSAAFFVATTSWIMSLAVNLNPLMRFDGYHFLADLLRIENLQARSFALGRWRLREILFDLNDPAPEPLEPSMRRGLTIFAWATWVYRFFLFLGIALLVHALFFKALGILAFIIEIGWFIMIPIMNEVKQWWKRRADIMSGSRLPVLAISTIACGVVLFVPWQSTVRIPAILEAENHVQLFPHQAGQVTDILAKNGQYLQQGDPILVLTSPDIENKIILTKRRLALVKARLGRVAADREDLDQVLILQREKLQLENEIAGHQRSLSSMIVKAPFAGVVMDLDPTLHSGRWLNEQAPIASVVAGGNARIRGYLFAENISRLTVGGAAKFIPDQAEIEKIYGSIEKISVANSDVISLPALTSRYGGTIAVSDTEENLNPLEAWYGIVMTPDAGQQSPNQTIRGEVHAKGIAQSLAVRIWRRIGHIWIRETSL